METNIKITTSAAEQSSDAKSLSQQRLEAQVEEIKSFREAMRKLEAAQETDAQRARRKAEEAKAADAKRRKEKKIAELRSLIAALRNKLYAGGKLNPSVAAQISALETQLFWLMFAL